MPNKNSDKNSTKNSMKYDVIIIGGGNAGFGVSSVAQTAGLKIAFVEERDFGGTCPNRGCTPKKVLVAAAHALHEIENASTHCIEVGKATLDWTKLIQREKEMIGFIPEAMKGVAEKRGDVFVGSARFTGPNSIEVASENGNQVLEGKNIVIATGSKTRPLPIPGAEYLITSEEVLSEEIQPDEVVFIGGGVIAMEFSHVYARAGTKVTILEAMPRLLPRVDEDAVAAVRQESERIGITVHTEVQVKAVSKTADKLSVSYQIDGKDYSIEADRIINGAGRIANVETLDLEAGNIKHDRASIDVDEFLRSTSNKAVWVCGDSLVNSPQLSPIATYEGRVVGQNIVNGPGVMPDYDVIPSCIYTVPALATVGLSEQDAYLKGLKIKVNSHDMTGWFSSKIYAETVAWAKVIIDPEEDRIIGAHMVGHQAEELIHLFAMAMRHGIAASKFKEDMFAFPTFSSDVKNLF